MRRLVRRASKEVSRNGMRAFLDRECAAAFGPEVAILNVGSGGEYADIIGSLADRHGGSVTSTDIDAARNPDVVGDVCTDDLGGPYDVILLLAVLEHVQDPFGAVTNIARHLNSDGRLVFTTPFLYPIHDAPHDHFRFTEHGLRMMLERHFGDVVIEQRGGWFTNALTLQARLYREWTGWRRPLGWALVLLARLALPVAPAVERLLPSSGMTVGYVGVARKPL